MDLMHKNKINLERGSCCDEHDLSVVRIFDLSGRDCAD